MIEKHDRRIEGRFGAVLDFERHLDLRLGDAAEVCERHQRGAQPDCVACQHRPVEAQFLDAVVDQHLHVVDLQNLSPEVGEHRKVQVAVRNGRFIRALMAQSLNY